MFKFNRNAVLFLVTLACGAAASSVRAQATQPLHVVHSDPVPVLPGRPDAAAPPGASNLLGDPFESPSAGIRFRAPANCKEIRRAGGDEIVEYGNADKHWILKVNRLAFGRPIAMTYHKDTKDGPDVNGLLEESVERIKTQSPGIEIYRQDVLHTGQLDIGMIAGKYSMATESNLTMIALVRQTPMDAATDGARQYYSFNFTAVVPKGVDVEKDPSVEQLVTMFKQVVDSVEVLDQTQIREEQNRRLFRTRSLFVNLTEPRLKQTLVHEQWLRLILDGKDIGYTYIVEETGHDLPRAGRKGLQQSGGQEGVLIGVRSRSSPPGGAQVDTESWMWTSFDRKHEKWSNLAIINNPTTGKEAVGDVGSSDSEIRIVTDKELEKGETIKKKDGSTTFDKEQPQVRQQEVMSLNVTHIGKGKSNEPVFRQLPPFYLPQAVGHMLPRLIWKQPNTSFLFATYNTEVRELMMRYVDVGAETSVELAGKQLRAIPISERFGLEGKITTHYVSPAGVYLGSVNLDSKITVLPTDPATLTKMWKDINLSRPGDVEEKH